jgi:hypothetical protein
MPDEGKKKMYKCEACGNTADTATECCGKMMEEMCDCGSGEMKKDCCKKE